MGLGKNELAGLAQQAWVRCGHTVRTGQSQNNR